MVRVKNHLSIFAKNGQSSLVLVLVLVLESKGPSYGHCARVVRITTLAGDIVLCSWAFIPTVPLSTQPYKWVPANRVALC